jgi:hypothetical protein
MLFVTKWSLDIFVKYSLQLFKTFYITSAMITNDGVCKSSLLDYVESL